MYRDGAWLHRGGAPRSFYFRTVLGEDGGDCTKTPCLKSLTSSVAGNLHLTLGRAITAEALDVTLANAPPLSLILARFEHGTGAEELRTMSEGTVNGEAFEFHSVIAPRPHI